MKCLVKMDLYYIKIILSMILYVKNICQPFKNNEYWQVMKNVGHLVVYAASASYNRRMFNTVKQGFSTTYDIVRFTIKDLSCTDTLNKQCICT